MEKKSFSNELRSRMLKLKGRLTVLAISLISAMPLMGCGGINQVAPVSLTGECNVFKAPTQVINGKRRSDQQWIDGTVERGVSSCGWKRMGRQVAGKG